MPRSIGTLTPPVLTTAPSAPIQGQVYFDTAAKALRVYDGTAWVTLGSGGGGGTASIAQAEVDFGATPVFEADFTITDAAVTPSSQIVAQVAYEATSDGKAADEVVMDPLGLACQPGTGAFTLHAAGLEGKVAGKFKINYLVG